MVMISRWISAPTIAVSRDAETVGPLEECDDGNDVDDDDCRLPSGDDSRR